MNAWLYADRPYDDTQLEKPITLDLPWIPQATYASLYPPSPEHLSETSHGLAYARLAAMLLAYAEHERDERGRIFMITSSFQGKSASWATMHLAYYLSQAGQQVLLLEGDYKNPSVHQTFDGIFDAEKHFVDLLQEIHDHGSLSETSFTEIMSASNLSVLPNLKSHSAFETLLTDLNLQIVFKQLRKRYHWILLDAPSILQEEYAYILGRHSDAMILLAEAHASRNTLEEIQLMADMNDIPIMAIVRRQGAFFNLPSLQIG